MSYTNLPPNPSGGTPQGQKGWAAAAQASNYQDMYKDIEAMRQAAFSQESAQGQFSPEFGQINFSSTWPWIVGGIVVALLVWR